MFFVNVEIRHHGMTRIEGQLNNQTGGFFYSILMTVKENVFAILPIDLYVFVSSGSWRNSSNVK